MSSRFSAFWKHGYRKQCLSASGNMARKQCLSTSGTWLANNICLIQETLLGNDVSWFDHFQETLKEKDVFSDSWLHYFPPNINSIKQQNKQHDTTNI